MTPKSTPKIASYVGQERVKKAQRKLNKLMDREIEHLAVMPPSPMKRLLIALGFPDGYNEHGRAVDNEDLALAAERLRLENDVLRGKT